MFLIYRGYVFNRLNISLHPILFSVYQRSMVEYAQDAGSRKGEQDASQNWRDYFAGYL